MKINDVINVENYLLRVPVNLNQNTRDYFYQTLGKEQIVASISDPNTPCFLMDKHKYTSVFSKYPNFLDPWLIGIYTDGFGEDVYPDGFEFDKASQKYLMILNYKEVEEANKQSKACRERRKRQECAVTASSRRRTRKLYEENP